MRHLLLMLTLLAPLAADAGDIPWFDQRAAEQLVASADPAYLSYLQDRYAAVPAKYDAHLHKAMVMVAKQDELGALYPAWRRLCSAEMAYVAAAAAYREAAPSQQPDLVPTLRRLADEWESAIANLNAAKISMTEDKLYNLEATLADQRANFDAYVDDRVLNVTDR